MALNKRKVFLISLLLVFSLAVFFRVWHLDTIPPGVYPDEAINANQAISQPGKVFYPENNGREGFFLSLINLSFSVFGIGAWQFRIVSAIIGILTVLGLYLLSKELFGSKSEKSSQIIALLASFFLATSFWHVNFSRIGFRAILVPFLLTFSFYFLFKGLRDRKILNFVPAGIFFGLGLHTYIAFRLAILILPVILIFYWLIRRREKLGKRFFLPILCFLLFAVIAALPIVLYFLGSPQDFVGRATGVSIFNQAQPISALFKSLIIHLAMFNFYGDANWRHNIAASPVLFWPVGILFLIGLILTLKEIFKKSSYQNKDYQSLFPFYFLAVFFLAMLLPGVLTYEGIPHSLRCIGAIPPVFIFAGMGGEFLYRKTKGLFKERKLCFMRLLLVLLIVCFIFMQFFRYFVTWAGNEDVGWSFSKDFVAIGNYLNQSSPDTEKYVIVNRPGVLVDGLPMPAQTVMFIESTKFGKPQATYLLPEDLEKIGGKGETLIMLMSCQEEILEKLKEMFPQGQIKREEDFCGYKI